MSIALPSPDELETLDTEVEFDVRSAPLGDGYDRIAEGGLHSVREIYRASWIIRNHLEARTLFETLLGTKGVTTVTFTPPDDDTEKNFRIVQPRKQYVGTINERIEATLYERFLP